MESFQEKETRNKGILFLHIIGLKYKARIKKKPFFLIIRFPGTIIKGIEKEDEITYVC